MATFKDLNSLFKHVQKQANSTLKNEIAQEAVSEMQRQIQDKVYDAYEPLYPENRRMYNDGVIDPRNIEVQTVGDNGISIEDIAYDGARNVPFIVESGVGYYAGAPDVLTRGRKFTQGTREALEKSDQLRSTMKKGLIKRGIDAL